MNLGGRESVLHLLLCGHLQRLRGSENSEGPTRETLGLRAERHRILARIVPGSHAVLKHLLRIRVVLSSPLGIGIHSLPF